MFFMHRTRTRENEKRVERPPKSLHGQAANWVDAKPAQVNRTRFLENIHPDVETVIHPNKPAITHGS